MKLINIFLSLILFYSLNTTYAHADINKIINLANNGDAHSQFILGAIYSQGEGVMCAEKTGGFNLVNYRHSSGVYHEQETEDLHRRI